MLKTKVVTQINTQYYNYAPLRPAIGQTTVDGVNVDSSLHLSPCAHAPVPGVLFGPTATLLSQHILSPAPLRDGCEHGDREDIRPVSDRG